VLLLMLLSFLQAMLEAAAGSNIFCPEGLFDNNCENEVNLIGDAAGFLNNLTYFAFKTLNLGNLKGLLKDFYACSI
jgi:hypothetical protein